MPGCWKRVFHRLTIEPMFRLPSDLQGIQEDFYEHGIAFLKECNEAKLSKLASQLGKIVRPRNEKISGTGISNIRFEPSLVGKGYSSEGTTKAYSVRLETNTD